jgi:hypothetical protein
MVFPQIKLIRTDTMKNKILIISCLVVFVFAGCYYDNEEELYGTPIVADVKWSTNIKSIIDVNCATQFCHGVSAISPDLTTYEKVFAHRDRIKARAVVEGTMPKAGPLSPAMRDALAKWLDAGAPNN